MKKPKIAFGRNKQAFDAVMTVYRNTLTSRIGASNFTPQSKSAPNPAKATSTDFRCDVDKVIKTRLAGGRLIFFHAAYLSAAGDDVIKNEVAADKIFGKSRHKLEQRLGAAFLKRNLFPVKNYFHSQREAHGKI